MPSKCKKINSTPAETMRTSPDLIAAIRPWGVDPGTPAGAPYGVRVGWVRLGAAVVAAGCKSSKLKIVGC